MNGALLLNCSFLVRFCPITNNMAKIAINSNEIDDAKFKISTLVDRPILIPEHVDITGEVDKLLQKIAEAEDKMAVMELHYGKKEADKTLF